MENRIQSCCMEIQQMYYCMEMGDYIVEMVDCCMGMGDWNMMIVMLQGLVPVVMISRQMQVGSLAILRSSASAGQGLVSCPNRSHIHH